MLGDVAITGGYAFRVGDRDGGQRVIAVRGVDGVALPVAVTPTASNVDRGGRSYEEEEEDPLDTLQGDEEVTIGPPPSPSFDRNLPRNITIQSGKTAILSCRVFNVNDKSVSYPFDFAVHTEGNL